jgi:tetratricopeptide (TPR) repeat protein
MATIDEMFGLAIELRDRGELKDATGVLKKIIENYPGDERVGDIYSVLGGIYADLNEHNNALVSFKRATQLSPNSELASLGLYLSYKKLDKDEDAILELIRYLKYYPANMYKVTLEELLEGLQDGYMVKYKHDIIQLARLNRVNFFNL